MHHTLPRGVSGLAGVVGYSMAFYGNALLSRRRPWREQARVQFDVQMHATVHSTSYSLCAEGSLSAGCSDLPFSPIYVLSLGTRYVTIVADSNVHPSFRTLKLA